MTLLNGPGCTQVAPGVHGSCDQPAAGVCPVDGAGHRRRGTDSPVQVKLSRPALMPGVPRDRRQAGRPGRDGDPGHRQRPVRGAARTEQGAGRCRAGAGSGVPAAGDPIASSRCGTSRTGPCPSPARSTTSGPDPAQYRPSAVGRERIGTDTASGKLARRPEWDNFLDHLRRGDELAVTRLSRMARSVRHSPRPSRSWPPPASTWSCSSRAPAPPPRLGASPSTS